MATKNRSIIDKLFDPHPEYPRLLAGAHRRRVTPLGAPALIRHVAFWNPASKDDQGTSGTPLGDRKAEPAAFAERAKSADAAIAAVYDRLRDRSENPDSGITSLSTNSHLEVGGAELMVLFATVLDSDGAPAGDCPEGVSPDSYRSIKISFLWHGLQVTLSFELHTEFLCLTTIIDVSRPLTERGLKKEQAKHGPLFGKVCEKLFAFTRIGAASAASCRALHDFLYHTVWNSLAKEVLAPLTEARLGTKFVDFRGLVVGTARDEAEGMRIARPFARMASQHGTGERDSLCDPKSFDKLWKFVTCTQPKDTEFTLSRFLENRAFYATALGSQLQFLTHGMAKPLYYLLYEDTLNAWQLGRLIYRVHRAGTARIAAIMHFADLRQANQIVTDAESLLEKAIYSDSEAPDEEDEAKSRNILRQKNKEVENRLSDLGKLTLDGTLEYRIERSRYYARQFFTVADSLRIARVGGYQQYLEFVIQRLGPVFEYIDSLGRRYERVQHDRALLLGRMQTLDSLYQEKAVSRAQRIADFALSCVLIPYYVAAVASHALEHLLNPQLVWVAALVFGTIMFVLIRLPHHYLPLFQAGPSRRFATAIAAAIVLTFAVDQVFGFPPPDAPAADPAARGKPAVEPRPARVGEAPVSTAGSEPREQGRP